jgi:hypothetical protein
MLAVASVSPSGRTSDAALVTSLQRLARDVELVLFCDQNRAVGLVKRMRAALPRHRIVSLLITLDEDAARPEVAVIEDLLNDGSLPVAVFPEGSAKPDINAAMRRLAHRFDADEILTISPKGVTTVRTEDPQTPTDTTSACCSA